MLNYIVWDVDPFIFHLPDFLGGRPIAWYGLLWAMVFIVGYYIMKKVYKKEGLDDDKLDKLLMYMLIFTIVGARLGHCLFYEPEYYLSNPIKFLYVWEGGLASHGGAIGILIGLYIYSKKIDKPFLWIMDRIVIPVAIGGAFIRTGNLMNSEIYGESTTLPWGFKFVRDFPVGMPLDEIPACHPTQIYEALFCIAVFIYLLYAYFKQDIADKRPGFMFSIFLIVVFGSRILIEFIKNPQVDFEQNMTLDMGQWLSIPFLIAGIWLLIRSFKKQKKS
ncbi:MAG: prolipoprotein diacylglyceryl transferase [Lentimicrobiaceae bacterium]|nr:prolipoprotein diacylglyceryl transferase [Lentimicrobiaceae bacterium]